jgi:simple sugar transport system permease protein
MPPGWSWWSWLAVPALYVAAGFGVVIALAAGAGGDAGSALAGWFSGAFGNGYSITQTLSDATPLALVALGAGVALRANVITVGAEGQVVAGATGASAVAFTAGPAVPQWAGLALGALAGITGGALWSLPPALARIRWGANVILFTLLANYVADYLLAYLLRTVMRDPSSASPQSKPLPGPFLIPQLPLPGGLQGGVLAAVVVVIAAAWWNRSRSAFLVDVHGQRPVLAARMGLSSDRAVLCTMLVSGAAAGLAGWMQVAGVIGQLEPDVSGGIGFAGLAVAVLGRGNPVAIVVAAVAYASLGTGASGMQLVTGTIPTSIGTVSQGLLLLAAALAIADYQRRRNRDDQRRRNQDDQRRRNRGDQRRRNRTVS